MTWQPIETAPKDGTRVLISDGKLVEAGCWAPDIHGDEYGWAFVDDYSGIDTIDGAVGVRCNAYQNRYVTHWMPFPGAPQVPA